MEAGGGGWPPSDGRKKWSIGKLFRRKKKESDSEGSSASSDENSQKNNAKRKKVDKKKRSSTSKSHFDHILPNDKRSQSVTKFSQKEYYDEGVLSDPSAGFVGYVGRGLPRSPHDQSRVRSKESLDKRGHGSSCGSQDGSLKKGRKGRIKARVEAMRNVKHDSSSDDESQRSTSSSVFKFRSDDSLANHSKDGSVSKRSRSARNDRYIKRLSRDDESQLNKEADLIQKGFSRSEAELLALRQRVLSTPQINGNNEGKIDEPDYSEPIKIMQSVPYDTKKSYSGTHIAGYTNLADSQAGDITNRRHPAVSGPKSSVYSYPAGIINFNAQVNDENITYSVPYNVNKQAGPDIPPNRQSFRRSASVEQNNYDNENVMVVKLPLGSVPKKEQSVPPPPPPRDPQRKVPTPVSYMYDNTRPLSYAFESGAQRYSQKPTQNGENVSVNMRHPNSQNVYENSLPVTQSTGLSWGKRPISTSEDHIAMQKQYYNGSTAYQPSQPLRPSSVSAEVIRPEIYNRYLTRPQITATSVAREPSRRHTQENANPEFLYFADKTPRSRRPIHIAQSPGSNEVPATRQTVQPKNASDFWRKMDSQEIQRRRLFGHNRTLSDQSISGTHTQPNVPLNSRTTSTHSNINMRPKANATLNINRLQNSSIKCNGLQTNKNYISDKITRLGNKENEAICYSNIDIIPMDDVRPKKYSEDEHSTSRKKSSNLEDALSELEAIYNSLGLGDEDLLDRAERREMMAPKTAEGLPYSSNDENYFQFPNDAMNRRGSLSNKLSSIPDKVHDDMAYRRMNPHERPKSKDASHLSTQVSYMLASPGQVDPTSLGKNNDGDTSEPDVILDDVVFRNIRQANNYLKIEDPQPPFGIPIGPVSPAPNSDYLHAIPDGKRKSRFIPQESPDIVSDDLAYRSLRKDSKNPSPVNKENTSCIFNNSSDNTNLSRPSKIFDNHVIKKKRAVRSLSANIFTLIQREIDDALDLYSNKSLEKAQSIPDLPECVVEYGKSGKLPSNYKSSQQLNEEMFITNSKVDSDSKLKLKDQSTLLSQPKEIPTKTHVHNIYKSESKVFHDELDTIAQEAKETSAKLVIALEELQKDKQSKFSSEPHVSLNNVKTSLDSKTFDVKMADEQNKSTSSILQKFMISEPTSEINIEPSNVYNTKISLNTHLMHSAPNIKVKGSIPAHIKEKMEEFSRPKKVDLFEETKDIPINLNNFIPKGDSKNTESKSLSDSTGKNTEDSLIAISNQLRIVGCKLKNNSEKSNPFEDEGNKFKYLANKCEIDLNDNCLTTSKNKLQNVTTQSKSIAVNSANAKYDFLNNKNPSLELKCTSPKTASQSKLESNNMQSFDDLRKGISELLDGIGQVGEKLHLAKSTTTQEKTKENDKMSNFVKESSIEESLPEDEKIRENRSSPEYNSSEELAMIFNMKDEINPSSTKAESHKPEENESHMELSSPRLVKTANQNLRKLSLEENDSKAKEPTKSETEMPTEVSTSTGTDVPWRRNRRPSATDNANQGTCDALHPTKQCSWYRDPYTLMLACYYSLICTQELAGLDFMTSLGILLAVVIIIAMLML